MVDGQSATPDDDKYQMVISGLTIYTRRLT